MAFAAARTCQPVSGQVNGSGSDVVSICVLPSILSHTSVGVVWVVMLCLLTLLLSSGDTFRFIGCILDNFLKQHFVQFYFNSNYV